MSEGIDSDFTGRFSFRAGIPFPRPDSFRKLSSFAQIMWYVYLIFPQMTVVIIWLGSLYQLTISLSRMQVFAFNFVTVIFLTSTTAKLIVFTVKHENFSKAYNRMRLLSHEFSLRNDGYDEIHNSYMNTVMKYGKIKASCEWASSAFFLIYLVVSSFFNDKKNRQLPIEMDLPYDWRENPAYGFTTLVQVFGGSVMVMRHTAVDIVLLTILLVPAAQMKYLKKSLEEMLSDNNSGKDGDENFSWFIENHQKVLRAVEDFKHLCAYHLCFIYGASMIDLFLTGVVVTTPDLNWELTKVILVLANIFTHAFQLYVLCIAADILTDAGLNTVSTGISSKIFLSHKTVKQGFSLALLRSIKPIKFTIAGSYPLCASTFMDMVRITATYFITVVQIRRRFSGNRYEIELGT